MGWPVILAMVRTYAPYVLIPITTVIGFVGYGLETTVSDRNTPGPSDSVVNRRDDRRLEEESNNVESLKNQNFVPKTIFEKNTSPTLKKEI